MFRSSARQRRYDYLITNGFMPSEAQELSRTTRNGMSAPYFRRMVRSRRRTVDNLKRSGYSPLKIKEYLKRQYINNNMTKQDSLGRVKADVWKLLRDQEDKSRRQGEEYESAWMKKVKKKTGNRKEKRRTTRRDMLVSLISKTEKQIERTANLNKRLALEDKLFGYQSDLRKLDK